MRAQLILTTAVLGAVAGRAWAGPYLYYSYDISPRIGSDGIMVADAVPHQTPPPPLPPYISNDRVFLWNLGAPGSGADYFTNDPGFMPISNQAPSPSGAPPSNLPDGSTLGFQVHSSLYYWDGTGAVQFTPAVGATLRWYLGSSQVFVTGTSPAQAGFNLHAISSGGYAHIHMNTYIWAGDFGTTGKPTANPAPNGIYLVSLQATDTGGAQNYTSVPLYGLFNNQIDGVDGTDGPYGNNAMAYMQRNWGQDAGGNWSVLNNWDGAIPNAVGDNATFWDAATAGRTINVDMGVTLGRLEFRNTNSYVLSGAQSITLSDPAGATISAQGGGSPVVGVPVILAAATTISNADAGTLNLTGGISAAGNALAVNVTGGMVAITGLNGVSGLTKSGAGSLWIGGTQAYSAGTMFTVSAGSLTLASDTGTTAARNVALAVADNGGGHVLLTTSQHLASLQVGIGGTVALSPGINGLLVTGGVTVAGVPGAMSGKLDLGDGDMIVQLTHAAAGADVMALVAQLAGYNGGAWSGNGIGISSGRGGLAALAVAANNQLPRQLSLFDGEAVDGNSILVKYTYAGDSDLDGRITVDDYLALDSGYLNHLSGYLHGDFNYDGTIDFRDYQLIDASFLQQSGSLAWGEIEAHAAQFGPAYLEAFGMPEPATLGLLVGGGFWAVTRRRRERRGLMM